MSERINTWLADHARPGVLWSAGIANAIAVVRLAWMGVSLVEAAAFVAATGGSLGALYWGRAWENTRIETAKANNATPIPAPGTAVVTAGADVQVAAQVTEASPGIVRVDEETPPWDR